MGKKTLLSSILIYSLSNIINAALPFLMLPVLTRLLTPVAYGEIAIFTTISTFMNALVGLSVQGMLNTNFFEKNKGNFSEYVGNAIWILIISSLLIFIITIFIAPAISKITGLAVRWVILSCPISSFNFLIQIRLGLWLMEKKPFAYVGLQLLQSFLNYALSLLFVLFIAAKSDSRLSAQTLALFAGAFISILSLAKEKKIDMTLHLKYIKEMLSFGLPLLPHSIGCLLLTFADRLIASKQLGIEAAGIYMVAAQLGIGMSLISDGFNKAFVPWLYEALSKNQPDGKRRIVIGTYFYFFVSLLIAGIVAISAPWLVSIVADSDYAMAARALVWIAFGQAFGGMYLMMTNYVFYSKKTSPLGLLTFISSVMGMGISWVLAPKFGIAGIGMGFALGMLARFILTWTLAAVIYPMPWFNSVLAK